MKADELMLQKNIDLTNSMLFVKSIVQFIEEKKGILTVNELSEHFNKSRQYLNRIFKKEVLYSLKYFITAIRILSLVKYKSKHNDVALTAICYDYGYFDQPHFIADFKKVCGVTPTRFFNNLPEFMLRH
jgi:AraC-like DNA-binding protein